ncbi:unnamed protein product [Aphanomyces euteiches]
MGSSDKKKRKDRHDDVDDDRRERKKDKKAAKIAKQMGYSNEQNPFNDSKLTEKFVWHKNLTREKERQASDDVREDLVREIVKVRKRRDEREAEYDELNRLREEERRMMESSSFEDWQQKEEEFHLSQARVRSHIRIREGREKPVDLLAKNLMLTSKSAVAMIDPTKAVDDTLAQLKHAQVELRPPETLLANLDPKALSELKDEIQVYMELEGRKGEHFEFWKLLHVLCTYEISRHHKQHSGRGAVHRDVEASIHEMLEGKSPSELGDLKSEIEETISSGASGIDVEYYEHVLQEIQVYQAKARLREIHNSHIQKLADRIKQQEENAAYRQSQAKKSTDSSTPASSRSEDDIADDNSREALAMMEMEKEKGMEDEEEEFVDQEIVASRQPPAWSNKYRPRKPRFFNRVKTGYDWNKYNQTHYDDDNPPPKIVQGYKFAIFYPDLIDKNVAPKYTFEAADSPEFCILRFHAGPPYLDIAFKVVNLEWEFSHKRGFKCVFERGILHLHFNFKRHRYRR